RRSATGPGAVSRGCRLRLCWSCHIPRGERHLENIGAGRRPHLDLRIQNFYCQRPAVIKICYRQTSAALPGQQPVSFDGRSGAPGKDGESRRAGIGPLGDRYVIKWRFWPSWRTEATGVLTMGKVIDGKGFADRLCEQLRGEV